MLRKINILLEASENEANIGSVIRNIYSFDAGTLYVPWYSIKGDMRKAGTACGTGDKVHLEKIADPIKFLKEYKDRKIGFVVEEHHKGIKTKPIFGFDDFSKESKNHFMDGDLLVFGGEGPGLSEAAIAECDVLLSIPMFGHMACLNIAVSTAIALYEIARQRVKHGSIILSDKPKMSKIEKANKSIEEMQAK